MDTNNNYTTAYHKLGIFQTKPALFTPTITLGVVSDVFRGMLGNYISDEINADTSEIERDC